MKLGCNLTHSLIITLKRFRKQRQRVQKASTLGSHLWTKNVNADDDLVIGVLLQNSPVRAGICIFTSHRRDGALVQLLWHFNEHLNYVLAHYTVSGRAKTVLFILFTPAKSLLSLLCVSEPLWLFFTPLKSFKGLAYHTLEPFFSKCGSPNIFSKSSSVSDSEPAAVPSASCNWEMPRWVSVGTRSVSHLQILPRQIVFAKLRFQGFHHIGKIHLTDHLGRVRITPQR